jgi:hypothetical protein
LIRKCCNVPVIFIDKFDCPNRKSEARWFNVIYKVKITYEINYRTYPYRYQRVLINFEIVLNEIFSSIAKFITRRFQIYDAIE